MAHKHKSRWRAVEHLNQEIGSLATKKRHNATDIACPTAAQFLILARGRSVHPFRHLIVLWYGIMQNDERVFPAMSLDIDEIA